jgi:acyl carrier protein
VSDQTKKTIKDFIVSSWLNGDERGLAGDTDLQESGLLDSLTTLSLVAFLEQTFAIQLDPADINAEAFRTLDAVTALVTEKMGLK